MNSATKEILTHGTIKTKALRKATTAAVNLLMNGHCDFTFLVQYAFFQNWVNSWNYGITTVKALNALFKGKKDLAEIVVALRKGFNRIMAYSKHQEPEFKDFRHHLEKWEEAANRMLLYLQNKHTISSEEMWRRVIIFHSVNQKRFENGENRLRWGSSDFEHDYRKHIMRSNSTSRAEADSKLHALDREIRAITGENTKSYSTKNNTDSSRRCWNCNETGHQKASCPKKRNRSNFNKNGWKKSSKSMKKKYHNNRNSFYPQQMVQGPYNQMMQAPNQWYGFNQGMNGYNPMMNAPNQYNPHNPMIMQMQHNVPFGTQQMQSQEAQDEALPGKKWYTQTPQGRMLRPEVRNHPKPCTFFRGKGCRSSHEECKFPHFCSNCHSTEHNKSQCTKLPRNAWN